MPKAGSALITSRPVARKGGASRTKAHRPRPPSRAHLAELLKDLCERLGRQVEIAEALAKASAPTGETLMAAFPMLKVIELAADSHATSLRSVRLFAGIVHENASRKAVQHDRQTAPH